MNAPLHILMLEDNPTDAEIIRRSLLAAFTNALIDLATDKDEYIELLNNRQPDVIVADNSLPQFTATEALVILHQRSLRIPFILVTGTVSEEFAAGIIKMGATDYILKDRLARLPSAIDGAIKQHNAENERLQAFSKLIESEEKYRTLIERITDAFIALDKNLCYTYVNRQAGLLMRRDPKSLLGKYVWDEFPDLIGSGTYEAFNQAMGQQKYVTNIDYYAPLDLWQENFIYPSVNGLSVFVRDISERVKADNEILKVNAELRQLSGHLQNIREEERIHIAREIHDELGQQLTGLKMELRWLQKHFKGAEPDITNKINSAVELVDETVKTVRRIASDLRPSVLDDLGLVAALEWHGQQVEKRSEIKVHFTSTAGELHLSRDMTTGIFRIYQELLTNAVRHANAHEITSNLTLEGNTLRLQVRDDGKGMDQISSKGKTFGLVGMKERTIILGGNFEINSQPGQGTEVIITIPYQPHN